MTPHDASPSPLSAGLRGACPRCGRGRLFAGYLALRPSCEVCGLDFGFADSGDGPAFFVMSFVGIVVVALAMTVEFSYQPPLWVHAALWLPLTLVLSLVLVRPSKGLLIALQYANHAEQGRLRPVSAGPARWRSLLWPGLATFAAFAILVSLGLWQLDRKVWKEGLIRQIEERAYAEPQEVAPEAEWPSWTAAADEYRRVRVSGTFLPDRVVPVHGLAEERRGQALLGFYLFEPLLRPDGTAVLVNRGFAPTERLSAAVAALKGESGTRSIVGLVRAPQRRGLFQPENDPARGEWFVRSVDDMARQAGLGRVAPFYVDADATPVPGGWPRGGQTELTLRNAHLEYALTWFGIALTLVGVFGAFAAGRLRPAKDEDRPDGGRPDRGREGPAVAGSPGR